MRLRALTLAALAAALWAAQPAAAAPEPPPAVPTADAAIVVDASDGDVMFRRNARERRQIASTTKLMTALLALERARPNQVFTSPGYNPLPAESRINLRRGERLRVSDLVEALLLESANDAAVTLAEGISGSREAFVRDMNARARALGLDDTSYANPIGLDDPDNYSTARDLADLSVRLMRNRTFARIVDMPEAVLETGSRRRVVDNRNRLVAQYAFVDGIKTGHTLQAGYILIGAAGDEAGNGVISVVLGEPGEAARDADSLALLRWGLRRFHRVHAVERRRVLARVDIEHRDEQAALVPARDLTVTVRDGERIRRRVRAPDELSGPIDKGERVGSVTVFVDGEAVRTIPLETADEVPGAGTLRVLLSVLGVPLTLLLALGILLAAILAALRLRVRLRLVRDSQGRERRPTTRAR